MIVFGEMAARILDFSLCFRELSDGIGRTHFRGSVDYSLDFTRFRAKYLQISGILAKFANNLQLCSFFSCIIPPTSIEHL